MYVLCTIYHRVKEVRVVNTCMFAHVKTGIILQLHVTRVDNIEYIVYEHDYVKTRCDDLQ